MENLFVRHVDAVFMVKVVYQLLVFKEAAAALVAKEVPFLKTQNFLYDIYKHITEDQWCIELYRTVHRYIYIYIYYIYIYSCTQTFVPC